MLKYILLILSLQIFFSCNTRNKIQLNSKINSDCKLMLSDSTIQFCGFFNIIKEIRPDSNSKDYFPKIYLSFHLPDEYIQNNNNGEIQIKESDSILNYIVFEHGPMPYFCSDILVVNAEEPTTIRPIHGKIKYHYQATPCKTMQIVFNNIKFEKSKFLPSHYVLNDTVYYSDK